MVPVLSISWFAGIDYSQDILIIYTAYNKDCCVELVKRTEDTAWAKLIFWVPSWLHPMFCTNNATASPQTNVPGPFISAVPVSTELADPSWHWETRARMP